MKIDFNSGYHSPQFQRKPTVGEMRVYTKAVNEGLKVLDKKVGIIVHNSSVPAAPAKNTGIGSLLSKVAELSFIPFLAAHAITTIQQEPDNYRASYTPSPYSPTATTKNIYMIPIERLTTEEYDSLVDPESIEKITSKNLETQSSKYVNYEKVQKDYEGVLTEAYENFKTRNPKDLTNEYEIFRSKNYSVLEPAAIYSILTEKYNNEDWKTWQEADKYLYDNKENQAYLKTIKKDSAEKIDYYIFKQWLAEREITKANKRNQELGIKVIGDSPIAFTPVEVWQNKDLFFENLSLGCPPDFYSKEGQRWGFAVIKPETIFNPDGSLGKGGELMKKRYEKMFESSPGGARIDHIIGLIDPHVYTTNERMNDHNSGRLYSSPHKPLLSEYTKKTDKEYAAILEKIVIPAAEKFGLSKDNIICEDLGTVTEPVKNVMKNLALTGISVTEYGYRGRDTNPKNIIMPGSHDNVSFIEYTDNLFSKNEKHNLHTKAEKLAEDISAPDQNVHSLKDEIVSNKVKFMAAAFAELFTSPAKKVQIFFTDFFGIGETYNKPGQTNGCWTLRVPENYEDLYYSNLQKGLGLNLPEAIITAIKQKGADFASNNKKLVNTLSDFAKILKE